MLYGFAGRSNLFEVYSDLRDVLKQLDELTGAIQRHSHGDVRQVLDEKKTWLIHDIPWPWTPADSEKLAAVANENNVQFDELCQKAGGISLFLCEKLPCIESSQSIRLEFVAHAEALERLHSRLLPGCKASMNKCLQGERGYFVRLEKQLPYLNDNPRRLLKVTPLSTEPEPAAVAAGAEKKTPIRVKNIEANLRAREILKDNKNISQRKMAKQIPCSHGLVGKLPAWKARQDAKKQERSQNPRKKIAPPLALTDKLGSVIIAPVQHGEKVSDEVRELMDEQFNEARRDARIQPHQRIRQN